MHGWWHRRRRRRRRCSHQTGSTEQWNWSLSIGLIAQHRRLAVVAQCCCCCCCCCWWPSSLMIRGQAFNLCLPSAELPLHLVRAVKDTCSGQVCNVYAQLILFSSAGWMYGKRRGERSQWKQWNHFPLYPLFLPVVAMLPIDSAEAIALCLYCCDSYGSFIRSVARSFIH